MKYFAILKDSLREALDSKVLYVLLGLALLIDLIVATLSFKPLAAERTLEQFVDGRMNAVLDALKPEVKESKRNKGKDKDNPFAWGEVSPYKLEKTSVLRGPADAPDSDYTIVVSKQFFNEAAAAEAQRNPQAEFESLRKFFAKVVDQGFIKIGAVRLSPNPPAKAFNVDFEAELLATSATRRLWLHEPSLFFGAIPFARVDVPLGFQLWVITELVMWAGSWVAVLLGVIITAFFIPNMLQKGAIDLLLVKPLRRSLLLTFKFVGGLTFILLINAFAVLGIWLVLGLRSGVYANWVLLLIPLLTFYFAILYSVSTLMAVLTRSTVTAILVTIGAWFVFFLAGTVHEGLEEAARQEEASKKPAEERFFTDSALRPIFSGIHRVLPRISDLNQLSSLLTFSDFVAGGRLALDAMPAERNWWESFGVSLAFIAIMLGLACWRFARKDY